MKRSFEIFLQSYSRTSPIKQCSRCFSSSGESRLPRIHIRHVKSHIISSSPNETQEINSVETIPWSDLQNEVALPESPPRIRKVLDWVDIHKLETKPAGRKSPRIKLPDPFMTRTAYRWETLPPSDEGLRYARRFFEDYPVRFLWSAKEFDKMPDSAVPEVTFVGRSNVGKSSILNALMNERGLARTSSKPGRTREMNAFSVGDARLNLLDMPGYGHGSQEEWGIEIMKYLRERKQLRRVFLLIDALHGPKKSDKMMFKMFSEHGIPFQIVLSKTDRVKYEINTKRSVQSLFKQVKEMIRSKSGGAALGEVIATATEPGRVRGIEDLRWAVLVACGLQGKNN